MLESAVQYARMRTDWHFMSTEQHLDKGSYRSMLHDGFIRDLNILTRYVKSQGRDAEWEYVLDLDRREIGDPACYIHCALGVQNR